MGGRTTINKNIVSHNVKDVVGDVVIENVGDNNNSVKIVNTVLSAITGMRCSWRMFVLRISLMGESIPLNNNNNTMFLANVCLKNIVDEGE